LLAIRHFEVLNLRSRKQRDSVTLPHQSTDLVPLPALYNQVPDRYDRRKLSAEQRASILSVRGTGRILRQLAAEFGISHATIRWVRRQVVVDVARA